MIKNNYYQCHLYGFHLSLMEYYMCNLKLEILLVNISAYSSRVSLYNF